MLLKLQREVGCLYRYLRGYTYFINTIYSAFSVEQLLFSASFCNLFISKLSFRTSVTQLQWQMIITYLHMLTAANGIFCTKTRTWKLTSVTITSCHPLHYTAGDTMNINTWCVTGDPFYQGNRKVAFAAAVYDDGDLPEALCEAWPSRYSVTHKQVAQINPLGLPWCSSALEGWGLTATLSSYFHPSQVNKKTI